MRPAGVRLPAEPRSQRQLEARPRHPGISLGTNMMHRAMIVGKCGLPVLCAFDAEVTAPAKTGRAPLWAPRQHHHVPDDRCRQ